jgi:hypothetical protein
MGMDEVSEPGKYYSPRMKKLMIKVGETFDAAGKAIIGFAGLSSIHLTDNHMFFLDLSRVGAPQCGALLVGLFLVGVGIYWQTEAER